MDRLRGVGCLAILMWIGGLIQLLIFAAFGPSWTGTPNIIQFAVGVASIGVAVGLWQMHD